MKYLGKITDSKDLVTKEYVDNSIPSTYAASSTANGLATETAAIPYATVDSTSTATVFTATVPGITSLYDGVCVLLKNGVITSASGFTLNVNGLGALPVYSSLAAATRDTTIFNVSYTMLFIYDSTRVSGGCWLCFRGYDANTNYYDRLVWPSVKLVAGAASGRYSMGFIGKDGKFYGFAQTSGTGTSKTLNTGVEFDPSYILYQLTATYAANAEVAASACYSRKESVDIRYSCNQGSWMTAQKPVYLILHPASNGYFTLGSTVFTQTLPTTKDGLFYKPIGIAYSTYQIVFEPKSDLLFHDGTKLCRFETVTVDSALSSSSENPVQNKVIKAALDEKADSSDIPTKVSDLTNDSGFITDAGVTSFNGNTGAITYTAPVTSVNGQTGEVTVSVPSASTTTPNMDGTASAGSGTTWARADHIHPTDTSRMAANLKGTANGVAELDANGKVPTSQLPSYVDDVLEYNATTDFPATGETGKIYVATSTNLTYRWSGSGYVEISPSLALGETSSTAYAGDKGKIAYDTAAAALPKAGGTMSGAIAMGNNKITGLANGTANTDAATVGQLPTKVSDLTNDSGFITDSDLVNADWAEDDSTDASYVANRPAIRAGDGTNSVVEGFIDDDDDAAVYTLTISGDAGATTFSYTTTDTIPSSYTATTPSYVYYDVSNIIRKIVSISTSSGNVASSGTITLSGTLSESAITDGILLLYYHKSNHAAGSFSHVEGSRVTASGTNAHAEGNATSAAGRASHAEGQLTITNGIAAHAEGYKTEAYGNYSHAEGIGTSASAAATHAEGYGTIASSDYSHVEGKYNIEDAQNTYVHIVGNGANKYTRSNAYTLDWSGNGVYAGKVTVGTGPTNNMDVATKQYVDSNVGVTSFNGNTGAVTYTAPVTSVNGQTGAVTVTTANADWEEDDSTDASYVENRPAIRAGEGENSVVEGNFINADPVATYTLKISGDSRGTTFSFTTEDELPSDTIIKQSIAYYANGSVSQLTYLKVVSIDRTTNKITLTGPIGTSSVPLSNADLLLLCYSENGGANIAAGEYSHSEGKFTIASGMYAHAEGYNTIAAAGRSHAEGSNTKVINSGGHAEGSYTTASGSYAHAEGSYTVASGQYAHAEGRDSEASGSRSHTEGTGTIAAGDNSHVEGKYNIEDSQSTYSHIVGNGTADDARSNAYTLDWNGNGVYAGKVTVGTGPTNNMDVATKQYVDSNVGVTSFNGSTGAITYTAPVTSVNGSTGAVTVDVPSAATATPAALGTAAVGSSTKYAREDHVHQKPTAADIGAYVKPSGGIPAADLASGVIPNVPTPSITTPLMDGTASVGLEKGQYALADHVHPSDTSKSGVVLKVWVADAEVQA